MPLTRRCPPDRSRPPKAVCLLLSVLLAAYLSQARPGGHGRGEPWHFPLLPRYWRPSSRVRGNPSLQASLKASAATRQLGHLDVDVAAEARRVLEGRSPAERTVLLLDLRKRFGQLSAVDGVSLSLAEGEIFALLGHNVRHGPSRSAPTTAGGPARAALTSQPSHRAARGRRARASRRSSTCAPAASRPPRATRSSTAARCATTQPPHAR